MSQAKAFFVIVTKMRWRALIALALLCGNLLPQVRAEQPAQLSAALELLKVVRPTDTDYQHKNSSVIWPSDAKTDHAECRTDCSGFIDALLKRTCDLNDAQLESWLKAKRPVARDYHAAIAAGRGFQAIDTLKHVQPGDILAIEYPKGEENTGHMMLVAETPRHREATAPLVNNTEQWEVTIIDVSKSAHGPNDTRHHADGTSGDGLGKGTLRIYTDSAGAVAGYAWSTTKASKFVEQSAHHMLIGRIQPDFVKQLKTAQRK